MKMPYEYTENLQRLKILFFNETKDQILVEALTEYETEKKEKEIELLNSKNKIQTLQSQRQALFFTTGIIGLSLLALILIYLFYIKQKSLKEKELLLKEIHHRVKNNLQIVSSLLSIQHRRIKDEQAAEAILESKNRVQSMALIHQKLYENDNLSSLDAKDYVTQLVESIFSSYKINQERIKCYIDIHKVKLDVDVLIPLGLIINELVTNSLKHAFPNSNEGKIDIQLRKEKDKVAMSVYDNGIGLPPQRELEQSRSFGFRMIRAFAQKLKASLNIVRKDGTVINISFDLPKI